MNSEQESRADLTPSLTPGPRYAHKARFYAGFSQFLKCQKTGKKIRQKAAFLDALYLTPLFYPARVKSRLDPIIIIFDPPYFDKKAADYAEKSISDLSKKEYLEFLESFFALLKRNAKKTTRLAFINADWRDFQNKPAAEESGKGSILIDDYLRILSRTGWQHTHIIQAPMSAQRFSAVVVSAMQKKRILGVTSRYVIILRRAKK
ncbi:MAG: hypothetical protein LWX51_14715 [Deltaproteobacteria bacterium]|jgi:hypothetical protein|nr:hypothetical protein [Deltaproteobacteria bacterium]